MIRQMMLRRWIETKILGIFLFHFFSPAPFLNFPAKLSPPTHLQSVN